MRERAAGTEGFTIMELMVVVAIFGLVMAASVMGLRNLIRADLRSAASRTAAIMRYVFDRAVMTGDHMRLGFNMDKGEIWIEYSEGRFSLKQEKDQQQDKERDKDKEEQDKKERGEPDAEKLLQEGTDKKKKSSGGKADLFSYFGLGSSQESESSETEGEDSADEDDALSGGIDLEALKNEVGLYYGPPRRPMPHFKPLKGIVAKMIKLAAGVQVVGVTTPRMKDTASTGTTYVYFFPQGYAEPAIVHLMDKHEEYYSVVLHPLTGEARVHSCLYRIPDDFGASDDQRKKKSTGKECADGR